MTDIDALIQQILAASRAKGGRAVTGTRTYSDEPILMRGSQLGSYIPDEIRQMRALARRPEARSWSEARLFVEQARLMADYVDDCPFAGTFSSYFPTYDAMDDRQLRGYFTWRAHVREGDIQQTSTSFAYVYLYELINGIGVEPGEQGFRAIEAYWKAYRELDSSLDRYVRPWLVDYAAYHALDQRLALPYANSEHDEAVMALMGAEADVLSQAPETPRKRHRSPASFPVNPSDDQVLFSALDQLSTYRPAGSRLYHDSPDDLRAVSCAVFRRLVRYYHTNRKQGLVESLFGTRQTLPHLMFASAVFYPAGRHEDCTYDLGRTRRYECGNGLWTCTALHDGGGRSAKLGQILRAVDRQLRVALDYPHPLKEHGDPKYLTQMIERVIAEYLAWRRDHEPRRVEIDLSKLAGIRSAAAETREALLIDEEREAEAATRSGTAAAPEPATEQAEKGEELGLTIEELALLEALLAGQAPKAASADLLADDINEKLLDLVGDVVIEFDETGAPRLVEDYVEDVRKALG